MWRTPEGVRTLEVPEAALVRAAIYELVHELTLAVDGIDESWVYQAPAYDRLPWRQRLAMLARVGSALLSPDEPALQLTALNEATAAALYKCVQQQVQVEIDYAADEPSGQFRTHWREMVRANFSEEELTDEETGVVLPVECDDPEEWDLYIGCLSDRVLWDDDYAMEDEFLDAAPSNNRRMKRRLGIPGDYYTDVAADPRDADMDAIYQVLTGLIGYDVRSWFNGAN